MIIDFLFRIIVIEFIFCILWDFLWFSCLFSTYLQGVIDAAKETRKLADKRERITQSLTKLRDGAAKADYESKVPEEVRAANLEKVRYALCTVRVFYR